MKMKRPHRRPLRWRRWSLVVAVGIGVASAATYAHWPAAPLPTGGTPRMIVDRTVIDFGDVPYDRFVDAIFTVTNAGDGVMTIGNRPAVSATKGC
jgi:hypothetical protein